jgi:abequosyltransferase
MTVLNIFIPTFNRAEILDKNLGLLCAEISQHHLPVQLVISDNASTDNTELISQKYASSFKFVKYKRNKKNLGMDGNFLSCFRMGVGKYTMLLGDDDYPISGQLTYLVDILKKTDANLVHLKIDGCASSERMHYSGDAAMREISFWITYVSSNIVKSSVANRYCGEKYEGSLLAIVPLYISSIYTDGSGILVINQRVFADGVSSKTNGGYSYFEVFVKNYYEILFDVLPETTKKILLRYLMKDIFKRYLVGGVVRLLFEKKKGNYDMKDSWRILFKYYGLKPYAYISLIKYLIVKYV